MNLVRLALITGCLGLAGYAVSIYAAIPSVPPTEWAVTTTATCVVKDTSNGIGMVFVALAAVGSALAVALTDLIRRVY